MHPAAKVVLDARPADFLAAAIVVAVSLVTFERLDVSLIAIALGIVMLAIAAIDLRHFLIPDLLSLPAIPLGLIAAGYLAEPESRSLTILLHLSGAVLAGGAYLALRIGYRLMRGFDGMGLGDVKLAAAGGAWVGLASVGAFSLLACVGAIAAVLFVSAIRPGRLDRFAALPFGTFLAPAIWLTWVANTSGWDPFLFLE